MMNRIAPGKRVRGNVEKWASTTVSLRGGRIDNSEGHPDADKVWAFGRLQATPHRRLNYRNARRRNDDSLDERHRSDHLHGGAGDGGRTLGDQCGAARRRHRRADDARAFRSAVRLPGRRHTASSRRARTRRDESCRPPNCPSRPATSASNGIIASASIDAAVDGLLLHRLLSCLVVTRSN